MGDFKWNMCCLEHFSAVFLNSNVNNFHLIHPIFYSMLKNVLALGLLVFRDVVFQKANAEMDAL